MFLLLQTFPFIFVLMTRKTEVCYQHIFMYIEGNVFSLRCFSMMTDFELAMRNALKSVYPDVIFFTCWFHLVQAVKKFASKLNLLVKLLKQNEEALKIYKKMLALPLLPANHIADVFHKLKTVALSKFNKQFRSFFAYYERQWIQKVRSSVSLFVRLLVSKFLLINNSVFCFFFLNRKVWIKYQYMALLPELLLLLRPTMVT